MLLGIYKHACAAVRPQKPRAAVHRQDPGNPRAAFIHKNCVLQQHGFSASWCWPFLGIDEHPCAAELNSSVSSRTSAQRESGASASSSWARSCVPATSWTPTSSCAPSWSGASMSGSWELGERRRDPGQE